MNMPSARRPPDHPAAPVPEPTPWWRVGFVWLVVGGPVAVVVASLVTVAIAVAGAEEVLTAKPANPMVARDAANLPAVQGRNHVATPKH